MLARLLLLFTVVPFIELFLLLRIGDVIGFWPTVGMIVGTGLLGAVLAKHEGLRVMRGWSESLAAGRVPPEGVLGGVLVLLGSALLIAPGVLTDVVGILLLLPPTRRVVAAQVRARLAKRVQMRVVEFRPGEARPPSARDQVVDVEARQTEPEKRSPHTPEFGDGERRPTEPER